MSSRDGLEPTLRFTIMGETRSKGRPRFDPRTRRTYTDKRTNQYEGYVAQCAGVAMAESVQSFPIDDPVAIDLVFTLRRPKKPRFELPAIRPDLDNYVKAVVDGMQMAGVFTDDARIVEIHARKQYGEEIGATVAVFEV